MKWSEEDRQRAMSMRANGMKLREIGSVFGRTPQQIHSMFNFQSNKRAPELVAMMAELGDAPPPLFAIEEAIARAKFPRTTTMIICGDPVLNQCALYRAQHGERL